MLTVVGLGVDGDRGVCGDTAVEGAGVVVGESMVLQVFVCTRGGKTMV